MNIPESSARLTRCILRFSEFEFYSKYNKEKENKLANSMSRFHTTGESEVWDDDDIPSLHTIRQIWTTVPIWITTTLTMMIQMSLQASSNMSLMMTTTFFLHKRSPPIPSLHSHRLNRTNFSSPNYMTLSARKRAIPTVYIRWVQNINPIIPI